MTAEDKPEVLFLGLESAQLDGIIESLAGQVKQLRGLAFGDTPMKDTVRHGLANRARDLEKIQTWLTTERSKI